MFRATLYVIACSARNRTRQRLRRLREPRYLVGAVAGIGYLSFTLFIRQRAFAVREAVARSAGRSAAASASVSGFMLMGPVVGGILLALLSLLSWVLPFGSGLLDFSKAETALLFPSPMSRRQLVVYRLMRSQMAVLTGALIMALAYPTGSLAGRLRGLIAVWLLLMTSHVFFTGVTLARTRLRGSGAASLFAWPVLALSVGAVLAVALPLLAHARHTRVETIDDVTEAVMVIAQQGTARWFLWPFTLLVRPFFATSSSAFFEALPGAVGVYAVAVLWLLWADAMSADAADASVDRQVNQLAGHPVYVARRVPWTLAPLGPPEAAFVWKGVLQTFRTVDRRVFWRVALFLSWMVGASLFVTRSRGLVLLFEVFATWGALFCVFMVPQLIRTDLRQDLAHLEMLKTWPLRGASVLRGEILWPACFVTLLTWGFGALAAGLSLISSAQGAASNRAAVWLAFILLAPGVVLAQYTMHNAVAVLFPGWVPLGASRQRGVDAVGQRLILLTGNWLGLLLALTPGAAVTGLLWWLLRPAAGAWLLPIGALVATLAVVGEMVMATEALGPVYDRLDLTSVERAD